MPVKIPKPHIEPLRKLVSMDVAARTRLINAIQAAKAVLDPADLIAQVTNQANLDPSLVNSIIWMLVSMYRAADGDPRQFASDAVDAARAELHELKKDAEEWTAFTRDLETLLACDQSLGVTAKVLSVRREYGNVFCTARILTDIRPVFGPDPSRTPLAAAIVHTLHIAHHEGDSHEDFYVALDCEDLRKLRDQIERAVKKEASLKAVIQETPMKYLASGDQ